jgi:hypothetical protein
MALDHRGVGPSRGQTVTDPVHGKLGPAQLVPQFVFGLLMQRAHHPVAGAVPVFAGWMVLEVQDQLMSRGACMRISGRFIPTVTCRCKVAATRLASLPVPLRFGFGHT